MSIVRGDGPRTTQQPDSKLIAHRNKLLGLWAAERMGMSGEVAAEYALGVVEMSSDDGALVKKIANDLRARGYPISERDVSRQLVACAADARRDSHDAGS